MRFPIEIFFAVVLLGLGCLVDSLVAQSVDQEAEYLRVIGERAQRIVNDLEFEAGDTRQRVHQLIAKQYQALRQIHDSRDEQLSALTPQVGNEPKGTEEAKNQVRQQAELEQFRLHRQFVSRLTVELEPEQVGQVKDGMTYGVVPATYARYLQLLPDLKDSEKRTIKALLIEAREYAMDGGSSDEKHGWFRKYKGRINNYLSSRGYDLRAAEQNNRDAP